MKIEKLTEDKIRIIVNPSDLELENLDMKSIMTKAIDRQGFFVHMLEKAKDEVGFNTDGCKLLIEAFSSSDDILVFTITKYSEKEPLKNIDSSKKLTVKRKSLNIKNKEAIYRFRSFDEFCDFCECINKEYKFDIKKLSKNTYLYLYNNTYYLFMKNIVIEETALKNFYSIASEFLIPVHYSNNFENKLLEHGKAIMKRNAIETGIKYFLS